MEGENPTPFWLQSTTNLRRVDRYRHRLSSLFFNVGVLLILLLVTAVFFMVFVIPTTLSFSAQIFRLNTVKKGWDSVNLVLVLFALLFGFLSRNRNDDDSSFDHQYHHQTSSNSTNVGQKSNPSTPNKWYNYSDRTVFNNPTRSMGGLIRRNSTSYPDLHLRKVSSPGDDQWRFYDDTHVNSYRFVDSDRRIYYRRRSWKEADKLDIETKNIHVDTFVSKVPEEESPYVSPPRYSPPPPSAPPPPPPPPPQRRAAKEKGKRIYHTITHEEKTSQTMRYDLEPAESLTPPLAAPPPPMQHWEQKSGRSKKRDGGNASKDNFITLFYHKKKKKRQRQRSADNLDAFFHHSQPPPTHSQPPPPPPPPPSPSVFHNLFSSRKGKRRRIPSDPHPTHPAPPPPPPFTAARVLKLRTQTEPATTYKPPLPVKISSFKSVDENSSSGGSSPLVPIPPPPPPPPFKMPDWKFVVQGDYVSIQSNPSSRSGSPPDLDDVETSTPGGDSTSSSSSLFCPSPDVDTKADNFIARFRAELKLQKMNSFNQKQGPRRMSNLGPALGPTQI